MVEDLDSNLALLTRKSKRLEMKGFVRQLSDFRHKRTSTIEFQRLVLGPGFLSIRRSARSSRFRRTRERSARTRPERASQCHSRNKSRANRISSQTPVKIFF